MPDPKKKANAPKNASTDTGTGGGKNLAKKIAKKATQEGKAELATGSAKKVARPIARPTSQTANGTGVMRRGSGETSNNPSVGRAGLPVTRRGPVDDAGSFGATHSYDFYDEDHQDRVEGRENKFKSLLASGGKAGTVGKYSSDGGRGDVGKRSYNSDPFLRGFNSDDHQTVQRPTPRRKKK